MVDAVGPVNTYNNLAIINWKQLTAEEVISYSQKGEDVPAEVLRWAQEYLKLTNAPDNVTYDSSGGVVEPNEPTLAAKTNNKTEEVKVTEGTEETGGTEETEETDDTENTEEPKEEEKTAAQSERQTLADNGVSLYEQGKIFIQKSITSAGGALAAGIKSDSAASNGEKIAENATNLAAKTEENIKETKTEFDALMTKLRNNPESITTGDLNTINELNAQMTQAGQSAQAQLANYSMQLDMIEAEFAQYVTVPPVATDYGTETVGIGSELVSGNTDKQNSIKSAATANAGNNAAMAALEKAKINTFRFIFSRNYRMGVRAIATGGVALDVGTNSLEFINENQARNKESISAVNDAQTTVENMTGVEAATFEADTTPKTNEKKEDNAKIEETKQENQKTTDGDENKTSPKVTDYNEDEDKKNIIKKSAEQKQKEIGAVKDTNLITDSLEIQRRKKEQGLA